MPYLKIPTVTVTNNIPSPIGYRVIGDNKVFAYTSDGDINGLDWVETIVIQDIKLVPWALTFGKVVELHIPDDYDNDSNEPMYTSKKLEISRRILTDSYGIPAARMKETIDIELCATGDLFDCRGTMTPRTFIISIG